VSYVEPSFTGTRPFSLRRLALWCGAVAGGVVLGAVGMVLVRQPEAKDRAYPSTVATAGEKTDSLVLERRVLALEQSARESKQSSSVPSPSSDAAAVPVEEGSPPRPDAEAVKARAAQAVANRESQFKQEYADGAWSAKATDSLRDTLGQLKERGKYSVQDVECKTSLCRARVLWPSYSEAFDHWQDVLHAKLDMACQSEVYVPVPSNSEEPYSAVAYFDCTEERVR
jgi:hypothetical protein